MRNQLKLIESLADIFSEGEDQGKYTAKDNSQPNSYFLMTKPMRTYCQSLTELEGGADDLLISLANNWTSEELQFAKIPLSIRNLIQDNLSDLDAVELRVKNIRDFVYTVV